MIVVWNERGFTLVELLVASVLISTALMMVMTNYITILGLTEDVLDISDQRNKIRVSTQMIEKDVKMSEDIEIIEEDLHIKKEEEIEVRYIIEEEEGLKRMKEGSERVVAGIEDVEFKIEEMKRGNMLYVNIIDGRGEYEYGIWYK